MKGRTESTDHRRKEALTAFLEARVREGFRIETRTDTHAIIVPAQPKWSFLDRLRRTKHPGRQVVSVDEHAQVTVSPAEALRF